jgi:hypothetical protein
VTYQSWIKIFYRGGSGEERIIIEYEKGASHNTWLSLFCLSLGFGADVSNLHIDPLNATTHLSSSDFGSSHTPISLVLESLLATYLTKWCWGLESRSVMLGIITPD